MSISGRPGFNTRLQMLAVCLLATLAGCGAPEPEVWHQVELSREFTREDALNSFEDYLALEDAVFAQQDDLVYAVTESGPEFALQRYSRGSLSDPGQHHPDWNRSFELLPEEPRGAVLLLHGMSDSPYSLRALGQTLQLSGYRVLGLRLPGHGTVPSGMTSVTWRDMAAATHLAMKHLASKVNGKPLHIIGYSTGAALALDYSLQAEKDESLSYPASLVLISPAIGISPAAALAKWTRRLAVIPGLGSMAWLQIEPEFDPYKYNSFAANAAEQVHSLTRSVADRIAARDNSTARLPPILVLKSTVDATVSNDAVVDRLLGRLPAGRHELVLFDINRNAANTALLVEDPGPFTRRLVEERQLPFAVTLVANTDSTVRDVTAFYKAPMAAGVSAEVPLGQAWPRGVFSLSHVALPFPPDDPLYGSQRPSQAKGLFLGQQALQGERDLLRISPDYLLRLRHNPFFDYLERRVLDWIAAAGG